MLDAEKAARVEADLWVLQQASLYILMAVFLPLILAVAVLPPSTSWVVIQILIAPLALVILVSTVKSLGVKVGWWRRLEELLVKISQLQSPALKPGEALLLSGYVSGGGFFPRQGRLTLTTRRLVFQRPRLWFWRPRGPRQADEIPLAYVQLVEGEVRPPCQRFIVGQAWPRLSIRLRDGTTRDCYTLGARAWRHAILRARRDAA